MVVCCPPSTFIRGRLSVGNEQFAIGCPGDRIDIPGCARDSAGAFPGFRNREQTEAARDSHLDRCSVLPSAERVKSIAFVSRVTAGLVPQSEQSSRFAGAGNSDLLPRTGQEAIAHPATTRFWLTNSLLKEVRGSTCLLATSNVLTVLRHRRECNAVCDPLPVRRPGHKFRELSRSVSRDLQDGFFAAVQIRVSKRYLPTSGSLRERRPCDGRRVRSDAGIDVADNHLRRASQHRSAVEIPLTLRADAGFSEVNVIPIRRKGQGSVHSRRRWNDLRVAARRHVAQPQALHAIVVLHVQNVFAVWRNRSFLRLARVRHLRDGEILKRSRPAATEQRVHAKSPAASKAKATATIAPIQTCAPALPLSRSNCCPPIGDTVTEPRNTEEPNCLRSPRRQRSRDRLR